MNKVLLACAVTALAATAFSPLDAREFKHSGCANAAEIEFPADRIARKQFKHWCKDQWKIYKATTPEVPFLARPARSGSKTLRHANALTVAC